MIRDNIEAIREYVTQFRQTGTVCSTSPWAAEKMVQALAGQRQAMRILEVGAGPGPVTLKILDHLIPGDQLVVCEINPKFMKILRDRLPEHPRYEECKHQISFFEGAIQDLPEDTCFDAIISALPFLIFPLAVVKEIFEKYHRLSHDDTVITYYEYIGLRSINKRVAVKMRKDHFLALDSYLSDILKRSRIAQSRVWANVLPINVYTLKLRAA